MIWRKDSLWWWCLHASNKIDFITVRGSVLTFCLEISVRARGLSNHTQTLACLACWFKDKTRINALLWVISTGKYGRLKQAIIMLLWLPPLPLTERGGIVRSRASWFAEPDFSAYRSSLSRWWRRLAVVVALMSAVKTSVAQYIVEANRGDFRCERFRLFSPMGPDGTGQPQPGDRCRLDNGYCFLCCSFFKQLR